MSPDEFFVGMFCLVIALITWGSWYLGTVQVSGLVSPLAVRLPVYLAPLLAAGGLWMVLRTLASWDVRESPLYLAFYLVFGAAWVGITTRIQRLFGLYARDDVAERGNLGAGLAVGGAVLGATACYAGANIGDEINDERLMDRSLFIQMTSRQRAPTMGIPHRHLQSRATAEDLIHDGGESPTRRAGNRAASQ
ncbi:MAG: hypothetical protein H0W72_04110 [Planctomycetes bacterium]|nr:hypothetical protein [Planctomycetota bacterium]